MARFLYMTIIAVLSPQRRSFCQAFPKTYPAPESDHPRGGMNSADSAQFFEGVMGIRLVIAAAAVAMTGGDRIVGPGLMVISDASAFGPAAQY
jgi:hypothetical protein